MVTVALKQSLKMEDLNEKVEKVCGYLELRRWNPFRRWKKFWFVLDGKILFYYENEKKYKRLGRCKGSINMSMAQAVHPCALSRSYPLEIVTRTKIIVLSACDEENRQKWLRALLNSLHLPEISSPIMRRLTSRISGFLPDTDNQQTTKSNTIESKVKNQNHESLHAVQSTVSESSQLENTLTFQNISRTLYDEIVEEVVLLTGQKLLENNSPENRQSIRPTPPKPPRITRKSSYRCTLELDISNNCDVVKQTSGESKTDDSELYESANESCYITAESSEYEDDTSSSVSSTRSASDAVQKSNMKRYSSLSDLTSTKLSIVRKFSSLDSVFY